MIIQHRQRETVALVAEFELALEVHLPEFIGLFSFKAAEGSMFARFCQRDAAVAMKDRRDRAGGRNRTNICQLKTLADLA